ncbi:MAG: acetyl-CoA carboxylase biotin carboxylase subunit [Trebonia sp.]
MIESLLIANRGEIACRVIRTARRLGIRTIAVYSDADADLPHVSSADEAVRIGPAAAAESYASPAALLAATSASGAAAVHPGYGFLSENAAFARRVLAAGLTWVGPDPDVIELMGDKVNARNAAGRAGFPVSPGSTEPVPGEDAAAKLALEIGYPVMVKAAAGGGGMGMDTAADEAGLRAALPRVQAFAERVFGRGDVLLERFYPRARHVEIQLLGLADGTVIALGDRDCSVQRRHQKLAEETPAPGIALSLRERMFSAAVRLGESVGYRNAGTVECLVSGDEFVFLEMNTRLQVEHAVTEEVLGLDIVEQQLRIASGRPASADLKAIRPEGHAIELRVNAEDPVRFLPGPGTITEWQPPAGPGVRVDAGYRAGNKVTPSYDSLLAKVIVHGHDRAEALRRAADAVAGFRIAGPKSNLAFFTELLDTPEFASGQYDTGIVSRMRQRAS